MSSDSLTPPEVSTLSVDHAAVLQQWSGAAVRYEDITATMRDIIACYVSSVVEFDLLGPEIKYNISMGLDEISREILARSLSILNTRVSGRSDMERNLISERTRIVTRVRNLFNRLRRECFPELNTRFVPAVVEKVPKERDPSPSRQDSPVTKMSSILDISEGIEDEDEDEDEEVQKIGALHPVNFLNPPSVNQQPSDNLSSILHLTDDVVLALSGIAGIFDDYEYEVKKHLREMDFETIDVVLPFNERAPMNFLISIPGKKIHITILTHAIESGIPFLLYLPMSVLDEYPLSTDSCKLNLIITGASAWFIGNLSNDSGGDGGRFKIATRDIPLF